MKQYFDIKETLKEYFLTAERSFKKASRGQEEIKTLIRYWGIPAYLIFYFVINWIVNAVDLFVIDLLLSSIAVIYFSWHIFAMFKCKPKKPKLTKEERVALKKERRKNLSKSFARKLLLQESISKWDPVTITIVLDLYFVLLFLGNII